MQTDKARHEANHKSLAERLEYLEEVVDKKSEQHSRDASDAKAKIEHLHGRLGSCEKHSGLIADLQKAHSGMLNDKAATDSHHATMKERVDYLENALGSSAEKHIKEVEALKAAHARLSTESKTRDSFHATITERVSFIEQQLGDSADKHTKALVEAQGKMDLLHGRLTNCEAHGVAIDALKRTHASLAQDKATRETHYSSVN